MSQRLGLRAIWGWAVQEVAPALVGIAVVVAIVSLTGHHFMRYWAELPIYYVIFVAGFALIRHRWTRRRAIHGPDKQ